MAHQQKFFAPISSLTVVMASRRGDLRFFCTSNDVVYVHETNQTRDKKRKYKNKM